MTITDIGPFIERVLGAILTPVRGLLSALGLHPTDLQAWALCVAVFMFAIAIPLTYGDWVLRRRQVRTTGTVVSIDRGSDVPSPRIAFRDQLGRVVEFESNLPLTSVTEVIGGRVEVVYDPMRPRRAREAGRVLAKLASIGMWYAMALLTLAYAIFGEWLPVS